LISHGKMARGIHRTFFGHQVAHVAVRRQDLEILTEVLLDRLGFRWRFDDYEVLAHFLFGFRQRPSRMSGRKSGPLSGPHKQTTGLGFDLPFQFQNEQHRGDFRRRKAGKRDQLIDTRRVKAERI
jgi:hypothetical protein